MSKHKYRILFNIFLIFMVFILFENCSVRSIQAKKGIELYKRGEYDRSIEYFQKALKEHPGNTEIKTMLFRSKLNSYYYHLGLARKFKSSEKREEAIGEYQRALAIFPNNKLIKDELDGFLNEGKKKQTKVFKSSIIPPISLWVNTEEKLKLDLRSAPITEIFKMIGKSFKINFIFDKDFKDFLYSIEIESIGFFEALNQLCLVASAKYRVIDKSSVLIYQNTAFKKKNLDLRGVKVFYLGNIMAEDAKRLIMNVYRDQQIMIQEDLNLNTLIIKASRDTLVEIERFLIKIDKEKSEVEIDVEILEVNRNFLNKMGVDYGTTPFTLSAGIVDEDGAINSAVKTSQLKDTNFLLTIPSVALNFLETDGDNKIIAKPNLRGVDGEEIKFMVGDELPIPRTQWQAIAAGGVQNTPVTQYDYKNVGVTVKLTPYIHNNNEVTLRVKFTINFVTGYINTFPILGKRELENVIRLKEGETNIIGGFIRDEIRKSLSGFPALSKIPILGKLFGASEKTINQKDLIFSITPRIVRRKNITEADLEPVWTNVQTESRSDVPSQEPTRRNRNLSSLRSRTTNAVVISPIRRRIPVNNFSYFTLRLHSESDISTLSISGSVSGGNAIIEECKTDFFKGDDVKVLQDFSESSFDVGFSFLEKPIKRGILAQVKIKFLEKGNYTISINSINAYNKDRNQLEIKPSTSEIEVY